MSLSIDKLPPLPDLLPHAGRMRLLDSLDWLAEDRLSVSAMVGADCALLDGRGVLPAYALIEYMAQGVATYAGIQHFAQGQGPQIGFLLGSRKLSLYVDHVAVGTRLSIEVVREYLEPNGLSAFACRVTAADRCLAEAVVKGFEPPDVAAFLAARDAESANGSGE